MTVSLDLILGVLLIFFVRVLGIALSTIRLLLMGRANKILVGVIAFLESLTFALAFSRVMNDLTNLWNLTAYCLGFAVGTIAGTHLEERLAAGFMTVNIVSRNQSQKITETIRGAGFGATRSSGEGVSGTVGLIRSVVRRKDAPKVVEIAQQVDPSSFVTLEEIRAIRQGFIGIYKS
jgi:uncharacterized protein YebE (UPF0316 family)